MNSELSFMINRLRRMETVLAEMRLEMRDRGWKLFHGEFEAFFERNKDIHQISWSQYRRGETELDVDLKHFLINDEDVFSGQITPELPQEVYEAVTAEIQVILMKYSKKDLDTLFDGTAEVVVTRESVRVQA